MSTTTDTATTPATPDFEFFQGNLSESRTRPQITVRKGGLMVLSRAAIELLGEGVTHVQLAYNRKSGAVGIRAAAEDAPGCYRLRTQPKSPGRLIGGKRFFQHHDLTVDRARSYNAEELGHGIVGFRLPDDLTVPSEKPASKPTPVEKPASEPTAEPRKPASEPEKPATRRKAKAA
jgi:hypothetical protein